MQPNRCSLANARWLVLLTLAFSAVVLPTSVQGQTTLGDDPAEVSPPIYGPDDFEPDNAPDLSSWTGVEVEPLNLGLKAGSGDKALRGHVHNFHVAQDEDWLRFFAKAGQNVTVETKKLRAQADTHLTVYQLVLSTDPIRPPAAGGCGPELTMNPNGDVLVPIGCNDDRGGKEPLGSKVAFTASSSGLYFARVKMSPKALAAKDLDDYLPSETSFEFSTTAQNIFTTSLLCLVVDATTYLPVPDAHIALSPYNVITVTNLDGVGVVPGLPAAQYTLTASAQRYEPLQQSISVGGLLTLAVTVYLQPSTRSGTEESEVEMPSATRHARFDYETPYGEVSLQEVLRVVQLYNALQYHCHPDEPDNYAPYSGSIQCVPHPLDLVSQDWKIDLSELLRMVQFFGLGAYAYHADSEDGLCAIKK